MTNYKCVGGHDLCLTMLPSPNCPYCEKIVKPSEEALEAADAAMTEIHKLAAGPFVEGEIPLVIIPYGRLMLVLRTSLDAFAQQARTKALEEAAQWLQKEGNKAAKLDLAFEGFSTSREQALNCSANVSADGAIITIYTKYIEGAFDSAGQDGARIALTKAADHLRVLIGREREETPLEERLIGGTVICGHDVMQRWCPKCAAEREETAE